MKIKGIVIVSLTLLMVALLGAGNAFGYSVSNSQAHFGEVSYEEYEVGGNWAKLSLSNISYSAGAEAYVPTASATPPSINTQGAVNATATDGTTQADGKGSTIAAGDAFGWEHTAAWTLDTDGATAEAWAKVVWTFNVDVSGYQNFSIYWWINQYLLATTGLDSALAQSMIQITAQGVDDPFIHLEAEPEITGPGEYDPVDPVADGTFTTDLLYLTANSTFTIEAYVWNLSEVNGGARPSSQVPIPGAVWLLGSGLIGLVGLRRKLPR